MVGAGFNRSSFEAMLYTEECLEPERLGCVQKETVVARPTACGDPMSTWRSLPLSTIPSGDTTVHP